MNNAAQLVQSLNFISVVIVLVLAGSVVQGIARGGAGSAKHLALLIADGVLTVLGLLLAWKCAEWLSPQLQSWMVARDIAVPGGNIGWLKQMYYTVVTGIRDFPLFRFGVIFIAGYGIIKLVLHQLAYPVLGFAYSCGTRPAGGIRSVFSGMTGAVIGGVIGAGRALVLIAVLFIYTTLFPQAPLTGYIQASGLYQKGATEVIQPVTGDLIAEKVPVFTRAVEAEMSQILQRKYEIIDAQVPDDIADAARQVTANATTDEEKARKLYQWVGSRVQYDWDKVKSYEDDRIWREQTPQDTFDTRKGVCIDYSRLYAVMARTVGLQVKVETGLGYDGQGGYGPHAWNVVYLSEKDAWVPLDTTWESSGGNWFNPPHFYDTHIREA